MLDFMLAPMLAYCYDPDTGAYLGTVPADPSPMEPGKYLIPAFSTVQPAPEAPEGQYAAFDVQLDAWVLRDVPAPPPEPEPPIVAPEPPEAPEARELTFEERL